MSESNSKMWWGDPTMINKNTKLTMSSQYAMPVNTNTPPVIGVTTTTTTTGNTSNWSNQWGQSPYNYTPPTEQDIAARKFQELMPFIDGLLKEAFQQGFKEGVVAGMEEVEKQLTDILNVDVIKEAQNRLDLFPESAV